MQCNCDKGTIFLEVWKRRNYTLAYEWDVNSYEDAEPDRPEFFGTKQRPVRKNTYSSLNYRK